MDLRDFWGALWRQHLLVLVILAITGSTAAAGGWRAPQPVAGTATLSARQNPAVPAGPDDLDALRVTFVTTDQAEPATAYSNPDLPLILTLGAALALGLAAAGALVRARRTHTVIDAAGVEAAAAAPLLAHVVAPQDPTRMPALLPGTSEADTFRHLRTAVESEAAAERVAKVVVAGVTAGDVNVWLGANLAISLAQAGRRVLLVDGRMGERFGRPAEAEPDTPGLYDVLVGEDLGRAVSPGPLDRLSVLPSGTWGQELTVELIGRRFGEVMNQAASTFDIVVVLGPPLNTCEDARLMAVGGSMLLAVPEGGLSSSRLRTYADRVRATDVHLVGLVLIARRGQRVTA